MPDQKNQQSLETSFIAVCVAFGIRYERPEQTGGRLDFYLPEFKLFVEIKTYPCERLIGQLNSIDYASDSVMVLAGPEGVRCFSELLRTIRNEGYNDGYADCEQYRTT